MNIFNSIWDYICSLWQSLAESISASDIIFGFIKIILIIIAARILKKLSAAIIKKAVKRKAEKRPDSLANKKSETLSLLVINICKYAILFLEVTAILSVVGLGSTVTSLLTTAGIGGLAIGLGAQSLISDAVNGFFMLLDDEYSVGDYISIDNFTGTVESISIRTTRLRLVNNEIVTIPNGKITTVTNYTRDNYQLFLDMCVSLDEDTAAVGKIMLDTAKDYAAKNEQVTAEPTFLGAIDITAAYQKLRIAIMVKPLQQWKTERELNAAILKEFKLKGIKTPPAGQSIFIKE